MTRVGSQIRELTFSPKRLTNFGSVSSAVASDQNVHQFRDLAALFLLVAARDCVFDAMGNVVPQNFFFNFAQGSANGGNLRHDVDAIAVVFQHFRKPANLTFDATKALQRRVFGILLHMLTHTPGGYRCQENTARVLEAVQSGGQK